MVATDCVVDTEALGRCCYDRRESGRHRPRGRFIRRSFVNGQMSVDRLSDDNVQTLCRLHDAEARRRNNQRFHGWYVFMAVAIRSVGWGVAPCPTPTNQWHAEVSRPDLEQDDVVLQNCNKIASQARWQDRPPADLDKLLAGIRA